MSPVPPAQATASAAIASADAPVLDRHDRGARGVHAAARPARRPGPRPGFTMIELIVVMLVASVLAVVALPRLEGALANADTAWREQLIGALRAARATAQGHRRLVCVSVASNSVTLGIASTQPASACDATLRGPDGDSRWAWSSRAPATAGSPSTLYFQSDGRVTSDGAGSTPVNATITVSGQTSISVVGDTGHVE